MLNQSNILLQIDLEARDIVDSQDWKKERVMCDKIERYKVIIGSEWSEILSIVYMNKYRQ